MGGAGLGIGCSGPGCGFRRDFSGAAGFPVGSHGGIEERRTQRNGWSRRTAASARGHHGANGVDSGAACRGRAIDSDDDQYCRSPVGLQHRTHLNDECYGSAELFGVGQFSPARFGKGFGNSRGAIRSFRVGSATYWQQLACDSGNRRAAPSDQGEREDCAAAARRHGGLFQADGRGNARRGEFRSSDEGKTPNVAIINQAFADRYFPHANAIGRKIWLNGRDKPATEIVGEVSNGRTDDLTQEASPEIYLSLWQATAFSKHLVIRTAADSRAVLVAVERELRAVDPTAAIENPKTLEQIRDDSLASRTFAMQLLVGFSIVGSVLTLVGIYGVLSLSVASRRRELAIRSAVGAEPKDIRNLIFGEGLQLIASEVLAGIALAIVLSRVLRSFLFEVQPSDPTTLIVVGALFVGVALLACWVPVRRAAKVDPLEALRYE